MSRQRRDPGVPGFDRSGRSAANRSRRVVGPLVGLALSALVSSCSGTPSTTGTGGRGSGGSASGGAGSGGSASGGAGSGGHPGSGGAGSGSGGSASGGAASGGTPGSGGIPATGGVPGSGGVSHGGGPGGGPGGNTGSGAAGGRGGVDASGSGGAAPGGGCSGAGVLFCDDFEKATAGMNPPGPAWTTAFNGMGTITIDAATPAHSGTKSVHVGGSAYQAFFELKGAPIFPASATAFYVRVYLRLGAAMTSGHNTYFKAGAAANLSSDHETRVGVMNAMLMINQPAGDRGFLSNQNYYVDNKPGAVIPPMTWGCIEAFLDPAHSTVDFWLDGKELGDLHRTDWQQDPIGAFRFGFEKYAGPDGDFWYDDIAVGTQKIGCD